MPTPSIKETISAHDEGEDLPRMGGSELEAFEAWAKERGNRLDKFGSALGIWAYENDETQAAFVAWQARAALSAAPQSDGWRPIESVPADDREFLVGGFDDAGRFHQAISHNENPAVNKWRGWNHRNGPLDVRVTHWQPLPTPPKMTQTQGQSHDE